MGDEKGYKKIVAIVLILLSINTWLLWRLNSETNQLKRDVMNMQSNLSQSIHNLYMKVDDMEEEIEHTLGKQASMVETVDYEMVCKDGKNSIEMWITPKVISADEKVILGVQAGGKWFEEEATIQDDRRYKASFEIPLVEAINAKIMVEIGDEIKQEALGEKNITTWLGLQYEAIWGDYSETLNNLYITLFNENKEGNAILQEGDQITLKVIDAFEKEVGQILLKKVDYNEAMHKELIKQGGQDVSYAGDATAYMDKKGEYFFVLDIQTQGGIHYKEQVAQYCAEKNGRTTIRGGGGRMYPLWE